MGADRKEKEPLKQGTKDSDDGSVLCQEEVGPPVPPDGGYGWVIMGASFIVNVLVDGVCFSFGIFFLEFLQHYQESKEQTSWVGSVLNGMYLTMGPIVGALANKFGCRKIAIIGSIMASASLILSTFSPNIYVLIVTYGALAGAGFGLMYLPAIVMVGYYFEKRRALATGIAVCGSGIGGFVFAPMCEKLIEVYGWKGATWIVAGLCLNGIVCGALFTPLEVKKKCVPLKSTREPETQMDVVNECPTKLPITQGPVIEAQKPLEPSDILKRKLKHSLTSEPVGMSDSNKQEVCFMSLNNLSVTDTAQETQCVSRSCDDLRFKNDKASIKADKAEDLKRPLYRKDIFYSGSVQHLAEFKESKNIENYVKSVTSVPEYERKSKRCVKLRNTCKAMTDTLKEMMDFSLLRNPVFCVYGLSCFLCMTGFFVPFIYLPDMAVSFGLDRGQAAFLVSIIGIANTVARVVCGWVSDQPWADCLLINNCALVVGGVATILCPFCTSYGLLAAYSAVFGSSIAVFVSLRSIIMVELMGLDKLTTAFGLVTLCQGLSSFIGAPIAGALYDATGYYNLSFYVAGATLGLAGIICFPLRRIALCVEKRSLLSQDGSTVTASDEAQVYSSENSNLVKKNNKLTITVEA